MGYLSSGMVSTWMATCQFHSNCASVCFELQLGCCYGAISLYNIKETAIAPRRSIWSLMSRLEHRRWRKWSFPSLCCWFWCLAWSIGKHGVFVFAKYFVVILLLCQFCSIPTMAPQDGLDRVYVCIAATFLRYETFGTPHCARGSCVRISSGRGQPRWAEVSRGQPRWAEVSRGGPRWAEVGRGQPRWAEVSRGGPRSAEVGRGQPIMTKLLKSY